MLEAIRNLSMGEWLMEDVVYLAGQDFSEIKNGIMFNYSTMTESFGIHWHEFYELEFVEEGECGEFINGEYFEMKAGDVYILSKADMHNFEIPSGGNCSIFSVRFYDSFVKKGIQDCINRINAPIIPRFSKEKYDFLHMLARNAEHDMVSGSPERVAAMENLLCAVLLYLLDSENRYNAVPVNEKLYIQKAVRYIEANFKNDIQLGDVADVLAISKCYLSSMLTKNLHTSFSNLLNTYRLRYATMLLASTDKPVTSICYESGYQNYAHFFRVFKGRFGMSPVEYRKQEITPLIN